MAISLTRGKALSGGFQITRGLARHAPAQTIDMGDAALSLSVGASSGKTQLTSDILYIDPNSVGGTENLLLPPEADCDGLLLFIANTAGGAEDIVVKDDSGVTTVVTISQSQVGHVFCDGTTWRGGISAIT